LSESTLRAGQWFLRSGIQQANGGVARYYVSDTGCSRPLSTEITGYSASALAYLHSVTNDSRYLDAAERSARFLTEAAWNPEWSAMPFELGEPALGYFFDCGMIVRGLLAVWGQTGQEQFREAAGRVGDFMAAGFERAGGAVAPINTLPDAKPVPGDPLRWSTAPGCYQLKAAMAWLDLAEAGCSGGHGSDYRALYGCVLESALCNCGAFLPGHPDQIKVVDRLHAFAYFLEGLLPFAAEPRCAEAMRDGIGRLAALVRQSAPRFERADVYAQLLRIRIFADWAGVQKLDEAAAQHEAHILAGFQASSPDPRIDGGFYFGRKGAEWLPHVSPVSTAFALQALALWNDRGEEARAHRRMLI
jgi:hypothetical protein